MTYFRQEKENRRGVVTFGKWHIADADGKAKCEHPQYQVGDAGITAKEVLGDREWSDLCVHCANGGSLGRGFIPAAIPKHIRGQLMRKP